MMTEKQASGDAGGMGGCAARGVAQARPPTAPRLCCLGLRGNGGRGCGHAPHQASTSPQPGHSTTTITKPTDQKQMQVLRRLDRALANSHTPRKSSTNNLKQAPTRCAANQSTTQINGPATTNVKATTKRAWAAGWVPGPPHPWLILCRCSSGNTSAGASNHALL